MSSIEQVLHEAYAAIALRTIPRFASSFASLLDRLESGAVRAAVPEPDGSWRVETWVKEGILVGFRTGRVVAMSDSDDLFRFFDKHNLPPRPLTLEARVRIVPGGTSVRRGAYLGPNVIVMPPAYVNVGAWVGPTR
jgi:2,3,4,5-tetrahydropyridine-2-carboxylate N-succinyltransferase